MDRGIERLKATITQVEWLLEILQDAPPSEFDGHLHVENFLSALSLKCIMELYDNRGLEAIGNIRRDARRALPIILVSLNMKHDQWTAQKSFFEERKRICTTTMAERLSKSQRL